MSRFVEDRSWEKKKKKKETAQKTQSPSVSKKQVEKVANNVVSNTAQTATKSTGMVTESIRRQNNAPGGGGGGGSTPAPSSSAARKSRSGSQTPTTSRDLGTSGGQYSRAGTSARQQASPTTQKRMAEIKKRDEERKKKVEERRKAAQKQKLTGGIDNSPEAKKEREDRLREAQRQKMGYNSMASEETQQAANRAIRNTPAVIKKSALDIKSGHTKTIADLTAMTANNKNGNKALAMKMGIQDDADQVRKLEASRRRTVAQAKQIYKEESEKADKRQAEWDKRSQGAKGLEKAYYGALESGVGMVSDQLLGPAWAASMLSRTYGNTRGQAQKEGATEAEDRAYSLLQGVKEVATEYLFAGVGLARGLSGKHSLSFADKAAKAATKNMTGRLADVTNAGIRVLGGTLEENAEEAIAWGADPIIKEITYGKNVRKRQAQEVLKDQSNQLRSQIGSEEQARAMSAYLGSNDFIEQNKRTYIDSGIGEAESEDLAYKMRDYLTASLSGDTETMERLEKQLTDQISGKVNLADEYKKSLSELWDTFQATTLLTAVTGTGGAAISASRGSAYRDALGSEGVRALANTAIDFEDKQMSLKAQVMRDRMDAGKEITATQAYDLAQGVAEQYRKDSSRQQASELTARRRMQDERLVDPIVRDRSGRIVGVDEVTDKEYESTAKEAKKVLKSFVDSEDSEAKSITEKDADRGSRAIAGFKTGVFTVDDANELNYRNTAVRSTFKAMTGIDLDAYIVRGKDGEVDIPATNAKTKDALFALAADNLVASAAAETANWMDVAKGQTVTQISQRMGAKGSEALQSVLDGVDARDRDTYMMTANASDMLYQAGRNMGTEWETAKDYAVRMFPDIPESQLKSMYDAGLADRDMAMDTARGKQVAIGEALTSIDGPAVAAPTGQVTVDPDVSLKGSDYETFTGMAQSLGIDIHFVSNFRDKDGKVLQNQNGSYDPETGTITLATNAKFEKNVGYIFMHECTHHLRTFAPEQYQALEDLVREKWFGYDATQMQNEISKKIDAYAKHGKKLTEDQALEEIIADAAHEFINDPNFAKTAAETDPSLAQAILESIRSALRAIRRMLSLSNPDDETHMNTLFSQLDILDEAERLWLSAYKQAVANRAAVGIEDLQNKIYEEGKPAASVSESEDARQTAENILETINNAPKTERFSISEPIERRKDLIAVHNLKADDIRKTFDLGGFPMPSIAVTKDSMGHDLYGDITLMFNSDTIDPQSNRDNQVFGGDAWTPTFPTIAKKVSRKVADKVDKQLKDILGLDQYDYTLGDLRLPSLDDDNLTNALRYNEPYEAFKNDEVFQIAYLKNAKNFDVAVPTKEGRIRSFDKQALEYLDDNLPELTYNDIYDTVDHTMQYEPAVRKARKDYYENKGGVKLKALAKHLDEEMGYSDVISRLEALIKFREEGIPEVTDRDALKRILDENVDQEGYKAWIDNLFEGIIEKTGIRNNKDMFFPSGKRRSWEQMHDPVTLENVVKVMKSELAAGGTIFGGNPKGAAQKQYKSLDEIRADEDRLQSLPEEEYEALSKEAVGKMSEVCVSIAEHNPKRFTNSFGAALDVGSYIAEILNSTRKKSAIQRKLKSDYGLDVTEDQMDALMEAIDAIANLPTGYFEAKPRRAVGFDEVQAVIIPHNTDEDIKTGLTEQGIATYEYDPDAEGDRTRAVNEAATDQDLRFSITDSEGNNLSEGQATFFADSKMVDAEGKLKPMHHGTQNEFYEFDITKAYPGTLGRGFYFSDSDSHAGVYGKTNKYYLNLVNPLMPGTNTITKDQLHKFVSELAEDEDYGIENYGYGATVDSVVNSVWGKSDFAMLRDLNLTAVGDFAEALKVFNRVNGTDFDGIITDTETIAFYPQQVKSVDNLNPTLSKDTRYSITDSDDKELTDGQVEYFKNSQARDADGRLVPVYHSTDNGGFTIFDPNRSDDERSIFFTNSRTMSESYILYGENGDIDPYEDNPINQTVLSVDELPDAIDHSQIFSTSVYGDGFIIDNDDFYAAAAELADKLDIAHDEDMSMDKAKEIFKAAENADMEIEIAYSSALEEDDDFSGTYTCYLNLEDPLIVDAEGANWDSIPFGHADRFENAYVKLSEKDGKRTLVLGYDNPIEVEVGDGYEEMAKEINAFLGFGPRDPVGVGIAFGFNWQVKESAKGYVEEHSDDIRRAAESNHMELRNEGLYTTRELAEIAAERGHDGVIIRNVEDYGSGMESEPADVYIAFSSNQVKDTRNENPTENPDIRYSFTDEEEDKSDKDYRHAQDDSYELLEYYESMISDEELQAEFVDATDETFNMEYFMKMLRAYGKADKKARKTGKAANVKLDNTEDALQAFYDSLTEEVGMVYDDDYLEEGRIRMANSKRDFYSNINAKWNDRWVSGGEVLDIKSVKGDVKNLIMGVMNNSNTDRQYKKDLVNKTLIDIRTAYQMMKQGRTELASALLYHSALRMISDVEFIVDDTEYQNYKDLRNFLRNTKISFSEKYWNDVDFAAYRKRNFGKIKLVRGPNDIDKGTYDELVRAFPEYFGEAAMAANGLYKMGVPEMMEQVDYVLNLDVQPFMEAYSSEDCAKWAFDIADDLYEIMVNGDRIVSTADRYKEKYDAQAKAMKTRHAEALLRIRKAKEEGIEAERVKFREYKEQQKEKKYHSKYFDSIVKSHKTLTERLLTNTKDKHIPQQYKRQLAELLRAFDLQTVASKKVEVRRGVPGQKKIKMSALKTTLTNMAANTQFFYINDTITDIMDELLGINADGAYSRSIDGLTIDELNSEELKKIDKMLKALIHEFNNYESVRVGAKRQQAEDIGTAQVDSCLEHVDKFGEGKDWNNFLGAMDKILNLDEVTPAYMFRMIDRENKGLGLMFNELRRSFGKYVRNQQKINEWMDEIIGEYHNKGKLWNKYGADTIDNWRRSKAAKEFQLRNGSVTLTPAQMMSIYCLSKRKQAYDHMTGAGIVAMPVSFQAKMETDLKRKANYALPVILTDSDIKLITSNLTPEQIKVADKLQQLMANQMAEWGNEASMSVLGIELFEDPDYFPIKSDKAALEKDFSADQFAECIRNFGFTKAVQPGARNAIAVGDIFDIVAEHCNQMNLYNSYSESMNDFMKVYNFHAMREDGSDYSVEQAVAHAYSKKATTFISDFMKDLNGNGSRDRTTGIEAMMNDTLGKAKKASVFANGRVALQQPTAIMRAFYVIDPKYLKGVSVSKATMQEMFEHSPIAQWKSWGYYDINMGKSIEDIMMNNGKWLEDKMTDLYGQLDNRTWTAIWGMCKAEIEDTHKDVEKGSDEYWELVSQRMDEVVDLTQVVDSPFHRSHAMRSKNTIVKMATAFMAEPTLTYNMVRDGFIRSKEQLRLGNKGKASKIAGRTLFVFGLSAFTTAAMAAIWDAVRGKGGDDDDEDQSAFDLWWSNCLENLKDNLNLLNNIYYVKDVVSIFQGWDQRNLGLQGFKHIADSLGQLTGSRNVKSKLSWWENAVAGIGYLTGMPFKTIMNDGKAILNMFGLHPTVLSMVGEYLDSMQDMMSGSASESGAKISSNNKKNEVKSTGELTDPKGATVKLWTYDDAPFHVEDGSLADNFLNRFGVNLTAAEIKQIEESEAEKAKEKKIEDIRAKVEEKGLTGLAKDKKVWSYVTTYAKEQNGEKPMSEFIQEGDFGTVKEIKAMYIKAGGDPEYFNQRVFDTAKSAMKKTISADNTDAQKEAQTQIKNYLLENGMSEAELSDLAYNSITTRDLKAAIMINDPDAAVKELRALIDAGLTEEDFYRIWDNRRRFDIKKYKTYGKYADRFKSTGTYQWAIRGQITSGFGHRSSPGGIGSTNHQGIDIAGNMGDPVAASDGGVVIMAQWYGGAGKTVQIQHDDGTITQYSHLSWWDANVGDTVAQGQVIGKVGSTGNSTGPHLHFGVIKDGHYVDPMKYLH